MSASNFWDIQTAAAGIGDFDGNTINCEHLTKGSFQVVWAGLDVLDGKFTVELSNDGVNWSEETECDMDTESGNVIYRMNDIVTNNARVAVYNGTNTEGAYKIIFFGRIR